MKRLLAVSATLGLLATAAVAWAAPGPKATGDVVGAAGGVTIDLTFNAVPTKNGVKGHVSYAASNGNSFTGDVTCYEQDGNSGVLSGPITGGDFSGFFRVEVLDNGEGADAAPDRFRVQVLGAENCSATGVYPAEATDGNIQVHPAG